MKRTQSIIDLAEEIWQHISKLARKREASQATETRWIAAKLRELIEQSEIEQTAAESRPDPVACEPSAEPQARATWFVITVGVRPG